MPEGSSSLFQNFVFISLSLNSNTHFFPKLLEIQNSSFINLQYVAAASFLLSWPSRITWSLSIRAPCSLWNEELLSMPGKQMLVAHLLLATFSNSLFFPLWSTDFFSFSSFTMSLWSLLKTGEACTGLFQIRFCYLCPVSISQVFWDFSPAPSTTSLPASRSRQPSHLSAVPSLSFKHPSMCF